MVLKRSGPVDVVCCAVELKTDDLSGVRGVRPEPLILYSLVHANTGQKPFNKTTSMHRGGLFHSATRIINDPA